MDKIKLLYAKNLITRTTATVRQKLCFVALVKNLAYVKCVEVVWAGEDGVWQTLPAAYHGSVDQEREYWVAQAEFALGAQDPLPGNVQFALRYRVSDLEYWDKSSTAPYSIQADSGIVVGRNTPLINAGLERPLAGNERVFPLTVAVDRKLDAEKVTVHWTNDRWKTAHQSPCHFSLNYWDTALLSAARNPNHYGCQVWDGSLKIDESFRVEYKISCETKQKIFWDDNFGQNYILQRRPLKVMILNLHCYQEENQDYKLSQIAKAIAQEDVDIVCLQEVAELWNDGKGDWETNTARIINERLPSPYYLVADWSHLGFDRYREGVAILSRLPIERHGAKYVSSSADPHSIHSRKVVMAQIRVPYIGLINVFSSHLSWWDDGFPEQFENLRHWAAREHTSAVMATMLGGDFNIKAGSKGYQHVVDTHEYDDQYLAANSPKLFRTIFRLGDSPWRHRLEKDHRIDYVFLRKGSDLCVTSGRVLFTDQDYGTVSDHSGYLMTFEPA